jgi:hypothetical protein
VGLFKLSGIRPLEVLGVLAGGIFYLYSIVDAYRSAGRISAGESPQVDEERLKRAFRRRAPGVGVLLLILGIGLLIYMVKPFSLELVRLLPVALVLLGGYLIVAHLKRSREDDYTSSAADQHKAQPYPLFPLQREHEKAHRFSPRGSGIFGRRDDLR